MPKHVLLVAEDDTTDAMLLERAIRRTEAGFHMVRVCNGDELKCYLEGKGDFADRVRHPAPQLVLLDLKMPQCDGFAVLSWRRERAALAGLPVIVFSSSNLSEDIERAYALGANSFVTKPTGTARLESMVQALHEWWGQHNLIAPSLN
ncbi:MAG: two-component system response regulator [Opitutus sp.]|nr:two-component system response regulator [Opitutus sp.]